MNETDGRRARGERARAQVLEHATAIASTDGLEGLTIGRVATDAGVGKGNIQVLFGDKETLQLATLDAGVVHYRNMVVEPALALESPLARLRALTEGWFDYVAGGQSPGGCFVCAASYEYRARPGTIQDHVRGHREAVRARFREVIVAGQAAGELRADLDVEQLVFEIESFRSNANVAFLMGDMAVFERARRSTGRASTRLSRRYGDPAAAVRRADATPTRRAVPASPPLVTLERCMALQAHGAASANHIEQCNGRVPGGA